MAVYVGAVPPGPGLVYVTMCFSGTEAIAFGGLIAVLDVSSSVVFGAAVGLIASAAFGPEVLPQLIGLGLGAATGVISGGFLTLYTLIGGKCTCPPGAGGFCVDFVFLAVPGVATLIPIWPFTLPEPAACTTIMPPGCP